MADAVWFSLSHKNFIRKEVSCVSHCQTRFQLRIILWLGLCHGHFVYGGHVPSRWGALAYWSFRYHPICGGNISFWSLWFTQNIYMNKYSRRDRNDIYSLILSMLVIGNLAINLHAEWRTTILNFNGLSLPTYFVFNGLLILAYAIILLQYWLHWMTLCRSEERQCKCVW